jgi:glutamate formiminotransferase
VSYNASAVKIYNATSSQVRFENITILFYNDIKLRVYRTMFYTLSNAGVAVVNSEVVGSDPGKMLKNVVQG